MNSPVVRDRSDVIPWAAAQRTRGRPACMGLAAEVGAIVDRRLTRGGVSLRLVDVTDCKARRDQWALPTRRDRHGIAVDGYREVPGIAVSDSEDGTCWTRLFRAD
jgi:transposase-like protein